MLIANLHPDTTSTESERFQSGPCLHPGPCSPNSLVLSKLFHDSPKVPGLITFLKIIQLAGSMQWYLEDSFIHVYRQAEILGWELLHAKECKYSAEYISRANFLPQIV